MTAAHPQAPASPQPEAEAQEAVADERYLQLERTLEFTKAELDVYRSTFGQRDTGIVPSTGAVKLTDEQHTLAHKVKVLAEIALGRGTKLPLHTRRKNLCAAIDELAALATPSAGAPLPEQRQEAAQVEDHAFGRGPWAPKVYGVAPYPGAPVLMVNLPAPITQAVADIDETMRLADAYARESGKNNEYDNEYQADAAREALRSHLAKDRT